MASAQMKQPQNENDFSASYDAVTYNSYAYAASQASNLYKIGKIFGIDAVDFRKCRVLELGGASGGNLITSAMLFPESEFVCVDYSQRQVDIGKEEIEKAGLKNMEIHCMSVEDITEDFGKFDYIIAHGLYSWIPKALQPVVMKVCQQNLTENGLAFISYNTLPGWSAVQGMRDMMKFHTKPIDDPHVKAKQAKALLKFLSEGARNKQAPHVGVWKKEYDMLEKQDDCYILHDHLEDNNNPVYLTEFCEMAGEYDLQYVSDVNPHESYIGLFDAKVQKALQNQPSVEVMEQYVDFLTNRRFRQTVLCHKDVQVNREIKPEVMDGFFLTTTLEKVEKPGLGIDTRCYSAFGMDTTVSGYPAIVLIEALRERKKHPISMNDLADIMCSRLNDYSKEEAMDLIRQYARHLYLMGGVQLHPFVDTYTTEVSEKPCAPLLIRKQAEEHDWVTNLRIETCKMKEVELEILTLLDGSKTVSELVESIQGAIESGEMTLRKEGVPMLQREGWKAEVEEIVNIALEFFADNAVLAS